MNVDLSLVDPFIRMIKIKKSVNLEGTWEDFDQVFIYISQGQAEYIIETQKYILKAGDFILLPPYVCHRLRKSSSDTLIQHIIHFDFYYSEERICIDHQSLKSIKSYPAIREKENVLNGEMLAASIPKDERLTVERVFFDLYSEFIKKDDQCRAVLKGLMLQLLVILWRNKKNQVNAFRHDTAKGKSRILYEKAVEYVALHYGTEINNESIANAIRISPNHLSKLFKEYTGMSLHSYVIRYRIDKSDYLLRTGRYNITEIASLCGFFPSFLPAGCVF